MLKIDSHQHFWVFDPVRDSWINDEMSIIRGDFLPGDLQPILMDNGFDGCVVVQSDQTEGENKFQLENAAKHDFIKGVVGWTDLQSEMVEERLEYYRNFKKFKGFRHILQGEKQRDFMLRPAFLRGIGWLKKYNYTYDILVFPDQLPFIKEFIAAFPEQLFVIDHLAKPYIKDKKIDQWQKDIQAIAQYENVYCKISGMVTEADWKGWKLDDFTPYLDVVLNAFGTDRIMYGSDWPVCKLAATYEGALKIVKDYFSKCSITEQEKFFGGNAVKFYGL
jgi:L-fuconolactonase